MIEISKTIVRRVGSLVVEISQAGIKIRGYGRRRSRSFTWEQIASLTPPATPGRHEDQANLLAVDEIAAGLTVLDDLHAKPGVIPKLRTAPVTLSKEANAKP